MRVCSCFVTPVMDCLTVQASLDMLLLSVRVTGLNHFYSASSQVKNQRDVLSQHFPEFMCQKSL